MHFADDCDAKLFMMVFALAHDPTPGFLTTSRNPLKQRLYRGAVDGEPRESSAPQINDPAAD